MNIKHLSFAFAGQKNNFFEDISISFKPNQLNFIQGKNGVGKSTLFNILQGIIDRDQKFNAIIECNNQTYASTHDKPDLRFAQHIKTVQQKFDRMIASNFTFLENLQLAAMPSHPGLKPLPAYNLEFLQNLSIIPVQDMHKPASLLSGGQRQILAIMMALQKQPSILLLDEPTAALDEENAHMVMQFLTHLCKKLSITVIIICHDKELVTAYAPEFYFHLRCIDGKRMIEIAWTK